MKRHSFQTSFLVVLFLLGSVATYAQTSEYEEGTHFVRLPMQFDSVKKDSSKDSIEVIEFFSYGCLHCYRIEPFINDWLKTKASDVEFRREHVSWKNRSWTALARAFYVAQDLKLSSKIHDAMFQAIHKHKVNLGREETLVKLFDNVADVDPETFKEKYWSDEIQARMRDVHTKDRVWRIAGHGTPSMVVGGKYLVSKETVDGDNSEVMPVVDFLIEKIRSEKSSSSAGVEDSQS